MEAQAGDVITGAGGAVGLVPDVHYQPPGDTDYILGLNLKVMHLFLELL
jgi:hypothetical protein